MILQNLLISCWFFNPYWDSADPKAAGLVRVWETLAFLYDFKSPVWAVALVLLLFSLIALALMVFVSARQKDSAYVLVPLQILVEISQSIFLVPLACIVGIGILDLSSSAVTWFMLVLAIISFTISNVLRYLNTSLRSGSCCLFGYLGASFDHAPELIFVLEQESFVILSAFANKFDWWAHIIVQVVHIGAMIWHISRLRFVPYHSIAANSLKLGL